jgi:hypothetical protein
MSSEETKAYGPIDFIIPNRYDLYQFEQKAA